MFNRLRVTGKNLNDVYNPTSISEGLLSMLFGHCGCVTLVIKSTKCRNIYAKWSGEISIKKYVRASKDVHAMCYSIHYSILCTLRFNKKKTLFSI